MKTLGEFIEDLKDAAFLGDADVMIKQARELFEQVEHLRARVAELVHPMSYMPPGEERCRSLLAIARRERDELREVLVEVRPLIGWCPLDAHGIDLAIAAREKVDRVILDVGRDAAQDA